MALMSGSLRAGFLLLILWQLLTLVGCEKYEQIPVPDQKAALVGRWSAGTNFIELEADGDIALEIDGATETFLVRKGSLRSLDGESICIGVGERQEGDCLSISAAPYMSAGRETISVEGVELARE